MLSKWDATIRLGNIQETAGSIYTVRRDSISLDSLVDPDRSLINTKRNLEGVISGYLSETETRTKANAAKDLELLKIGI